MPVSALVRATASHAELDPDEYSRPRAHREGVHRRRRRLPGRARRSGSPRPTAAPTRSPSTARCARVNPSPYMFFLDFGDSRIVGASPEMLVRVDGRRGRRRARSPARGRAARTAPRTTAARRGAAGRREGARRARDAGRPRPQRRRPRLRARHRARAAADGDRALLARHAHRLAASTGELRRRTRPRSTRCGACFPAGTVSGAPKIRAMEIIAELEPAPPRRLRRRGRLLRLRGRPGHVHRDPHRSSCATATAHVQAGAGIVADSDPGSRVRGDAEQGAALLRGGSAHGRAETARRSMRPAASTTTTRSPTTSSSTSASSAPTSTVRRNDALDRRRRRERSRPTRS